MVSRFTVWSTDDIRDYRGAKWHWPGDGGLTACGRALAHQDEHVFEMNAQYVAPLALCDSPGCRERKTVLPLGFEFEDECGCRWYVGDLDPQHIVHACDEHLGTKFIRDEDGILEEVFD